MPAHRASAQLHNTLRDALATGALSSPIWTWDVSSFARSRTLNWLRGRGGREGKREKLSFSAWVSPTAAGVDGDGDAHDRPPARTHARPNRSTHDAMPDLRFAAVRCRAGRAACLGDRTKLGGFLAGASGFCCCGCAGCECGGGVSGLADHSRIRGAVVPGDA